VPWLPTLYGLANALTGISREKATGLAAVAGGLAEMFVLWGIVAMVIAQVVAIILLFRGFERGHLVRGLFAVVSIGLSGLMLAFVGLFLWMLWFQAHHRY
jgi:hypothetical protein